MVPRARLVAGHEAGMTVPPARREAGGRHDGSLRIHLKGARAPPWARRSVACWHGTSRAGAPTQHHRPALASLQAMLHRFVSLDRVHAADTRLRSDTGGRGNEHRADTDTLPASGPS